MKFNSLYVGENAVKRFQKKSEKIENIFSKTIDRLTKLNESIDKQIANENEEITYLQQEISNSENRKAELENNKKRNNKLKAKFVDFLNIDEDKESATE